MRVSAPRCCSSALLLREQAAEGISTPMESVTTAECVRDLQLQGLTQSLKGRDRQISALSARNFQTCVVSAISATGRLRRASPIGIKVMQVGA